MIGFGTPVTSWSYQASSTLWCSMTRKFSVADAQCTLEKRVTGLPAM